MLLKINKGYILLPSPFTNGSMFFTREISVNELTDSLIRHLFFTEPAIRITNSEELVSGS